MIKNSIYPVILCGGTGTRLWPLSRKSYPKQYLPLIADNNKSLLQKTQERLLKLEKINNSIFICNEEHRFIVAEQIRALNVIPESIILEPFGRNTAPAIALAALIALKKENDPILFILSSDHLIKDESQFKKVFEVGKAYAAQDKIVTFGIVPDSPETGYGYIKAKQKLNNSDPKGSEIDMFIEKPNIETAKKFIKDKRFTWNSGMFIFKAKVIIDEIERKFPEIISSCKKSIEKSKTDLDFERINSKSFKDCPNISIDVAVMEQTDKGIVIPLNAGWSDIGSWKSVWENSRKDQHNNFIKGKVITKNSKNCYFRSEDRLVVSLGLQDLIVIETNDAILIANKDEDQKIKDIVEELKDKNIAEGQNHKEVYRPWGSYTSIVEDSRWKVKQINVKPGESLSLQKHRHRAEHWVVVTGTANVEVNDRNLQVCANQSIYIPLGAKHRLSNSGEEMLVIIEIQTGTYLGEDDIIRFEDKYGR
ncbi:mannose-1-phosphate guanylyltransferase/mannose-6-phosphate isomerase [Prochlorococcus sp. AH-736-A21]|nr:mannose-1-phosphate guanylyltransferase/mannose-6-phosphate isomerase [Prochlorococcus sp. AH-736-A21]